MFIKTVYFQLIVFEFIQAKSNKEKGIVIFVVFHILAFLLLWCMYKTTFTEAGNVVNVKFYQQKIKKKYYYNKKVLKMEFRNLTIYINVERIIGLNL